MELVSDVIRPPHPIPPLAQPSSVSIIAISYKLMDWKSPIFYLLSYVTYYWFFYVIHVHAFTDNYNRPREQMHSIITYNVQLKYYNSNMWPSSAHFLEVHINYVQDTDFV